MNKEFFEERPVGGSTFQMSEYPEGYDPTQQVDSDLTLEQKISSRVWKFRQEAIQLITKDNLWEEYQSSVINMLSDNMIQVQEEAYNALKALLKTSCVSKIIEKLPIKMKSSLNEIFIDLVEKTRKIEDILSALTQGLQLKIPKQIQTTLYIIHVLIQNYGTNYLKNLDNFWVELEIKVQMTNPDIMQDTMKILKECVYFMGPAVRAKLQQVKPKILEEFDSFLKTNPETKKPLRQEFLDAQNIAPEAQVDLYDASIPVDVLSGISESWLDKILAIEKWNLKKEQLDLILAKLKSASRIQPKPFIPYQTFLKRILQDANMNIQISGIKIIQEMATRVRKPLSSMSKVLLPYIIQKLRDKKSLLIDAVQNCLNHIFSHVLHIEDLNSEISEFLNDKTPQCKVQLIIFLESQIKKNKKIIILKREPLKKLMEDGIAEVRNAMNHLVNILNDQFGVESIYEVFGEIQPSLMTKLEKILGESYEQIRKSVKSTKQQVNHKKNDSYINLDSPEQHLNEYLQNFFSSFDGCIAWEKKQAILQSLIVDNIDQKSVYPLCLSFQTRFKSWKEQNINLNRALLNIIQQISPMMTVEVLPCILPLLLNKIVETAFSSIVTGILQTMTKQIPLKIIVSQCLPLLKFPKQIQEFQEFLLSFLPNQIQTFPFQIVQNFIKAQPKPIMPNLYKKMISLQPNESQMPNNDKTQIGKLFKGLQIENTAMKALDDLRKYLNNETLSQSDQEEFLSICKKILKNQKNKVISKQYFQLIAILFENGQGEIFIPFVMNFIQEKQILIKSEIMNALIIAANKFPNPYVSCIISKLNLFTNDRPELWNCLQSVNFQNLDQNIIQTLLLEAQKDGVEIQGISQPVDCDYFKIEEQDVINLQKNLGQKVGNTVISGLFSYSMNYFLQTLDQFKNHLPANKQLSCLFIQYLKMRVLNSTQNNVIGMKLYDCLVTLFQTWFLDPNIQKSDQELAQFLVVTFELWGNYSLNMVTNLKSIIQHILSQQKQQDSVKILIQCYQRYDQTLKCELYYIIDNNYRQLVDRNIMQDIDREIQLQTVQKDIKMEQDIIQNDEMFYEYLQRLANEDFEQKNQTISMLLQYEVNDFKQNEIFDHIQQMIRTCFTESIHFIQNTFLNNLTSFVLNFITISKQIDARNLIMDVLNNLLRHSQIKTDFSEQQTKNLNSIILKYIACYPDQGFQTLFGLIIQQKNILINQPSLQNEQLQNLLIKCLLKINQYLIKNTSNFNIPAIFLTCHRYISQFYGDRLLQNDDMVIMTMKTITQNLVEIFQEQIMKIYEQTFVDIKENQILLWIQLFSKLNKQDSQNNPNQANLPNYQMNMSYSMPKENAFYGLCLSTPQKKFNPIHSESVQAIQLQSLQDQFQQQKNIITPQAQPQVQQTEELQIMVDIFKGDQNISIEPIYNFIKNKNLNLMPYFCDCSLSVLSLFIQKILEIHSQNMKINSNDKIIITSLIDLESSMKNQDVSNNGQPLPQIQDYIKNRFNLHQEKQQQPQIQPDNYLQNIQEARNHLRQKMGLNPIHH